MREGLFRPIILGVILFLTGAQLALGGSGLSEEKGERFVTVITAAMAVWNVGIAFVVGPWLEDFHVGVNM